MSQSTERIVNQRNSLSSADASAFISKEKARVNAWEKGISYAENAVTNALSGGTKLFTALKKQSEENTQNNVDKYRTTVVDGYLETTLADSKDKFSRGELSWNPDDADNDVMNYYYNTCKNGILEDAEKRGLSKAEKAVLAKNLDSWIHSKSNSLIDFCITNGREQAIEAVGDKAQDNTSLIRQGDVRDIDNSLFLNMIDSHGYSKEGIHSYIDEAEDVSAYKAYETAFSTKNTTEENIEAIKKENNSVYESAVAELNLSGIEVTPDSILVAIKNKHDIEESKANYYMAKTSRWLAEYSIDGDKERADAVVDMLDNQIIADVVTGTLISGMANDLANEDNYGLSFDEVATRYPVEGNLNNPITGKPYSVEEAQAVQFTFETQKIKLRAEYEQFNESAYLQSKKELDSIISSGTYPTSDVVDGILKKNNCHTKDLLSDDNRRYIENVKTTGDMRASLSKAKDNGGFYDENTLNTLPVDVQNRVVYGNTPVSPSSSGLPSGYSYNAYGDIVNVFTIATMANSIDSSYASALATYRTSGDSKNLVNVLSATANNYSAISKAGTEIEKQIASIEEAQTVAELLYKDAMYTYRGHGIESALSQSFVNGELNFDIPFDENSYGEVARMMCETLVATVAVVANENGENYTYNPETKEFTFNLGDKGTWTGKQEDLSSIITEIICSQATKSAHDRAIEFFNSHVNEGYDINALYDSFYEQEINARMTQADSIGKNRICNQFNTEVSESANNAKGIDFSKYKLTLTSSTFNASKYAGNNINGFMNNVDNYGKLTRTLTGANFIDNQTGEELEPMYYALQKFLASTESTTWDDICNEADADWVHYSEEMVETMRKEGLGKIISGLKGKTGDILTKINNLANEFGTDGDNNFIRSQIVKGIFNNLPMINGELDEQSVSTMFSAIRSELRQQYAYAWVENKSKKGTFIAEVGSGVGEGKRFKEYKLGCIESGDKILNGTSGLSYIGSKEHIGQATNLPTRDFAQLVDSKLSDDELFRVCINLSAQMRGETAVASFDAEDFTDRLEERMNNNPSLWNIVEQEAGALYRRESQRRELEKSFLNVNDFDYSTGIATIDNGIKVKAGTGLNFTILDKDGNDTGEDYKIITRDYAMNLKGQILSEMTAFVPPSVKEEYLRNSVTGNETTLLSFSNTARKYYERVNKLIDCGAIESYWGFNVEAISAPEKEDISGKKKTDYTQAEWEMLETIQAYQSGEGIADVGSSVTGVKISTVAMTKSPSNDELKSSFDVYSKKFEDIIASPIKDAWNKREMRGSIM